MKPCKTPLAALLALMLLALPTPAEEKQAGFEPYEAWFVLKMGGQRAGHMHTTLKEEDDKLVSTTTMMIVIKRGDAEIRIDQSTRFIETTDHKPLSSESSMKFALMATEQHIDYTGEQWVVTSKNAGQQTQTKIDPPDIGWLTPGGTAAYLDKAIADGEEELSVTTLDPSAGTSPITIKMKRGESKNIEVFGKIIPATKWLTTMTAAPGIEIEQWTDENGQPVRQTIPLMPGMEMEMLLADKALALAEFDAPELLAASLIEPDKPIQNPRKLKRAVFDISGEDLKKNIGDTMVNDGYQTTKWVDGDTLRIEIDLDKPKKQRDEAPDEAYLAASSMLNHNDQAVKRLHELLPDYAADVHPEEIAEDARGVVRDHIDEKDLSVGFASASETARTKQGDCTEHACLLAAMLRGVGIPSRTVTGLVYADQFAGHEGVFGFHMWTQAWIATDDGKGYWLDLDAAAPGKVGGFDATHIALATSAMADGETFNDMVTLLPLMKGMDIKVVETEWAE